MNLDEVVCPCMNVTNGMIKEAVDAGARTLEDIQDKTGATTICGACMDDVQKLLDLFLNEK